MECRASANRHIEAMELDSRLRQTWKIVQGTPASLNSNYFDPILRARLYKHHPKLQPFEEFYKNQLRLQKKSLKPRKGPPRSRDDFRCNDLVMVNIIPLSLN